MNTPSGFSDADREYHAYQARQNYLRQERTIQNEIASSRKEKQAALQRTEAALQRTEAALQEKQAALQRTEAALAEIERLKALLRG